MMGLNMGWKNDVSVAVNNIDKAVAVTQANLQNLANSFHSFKKEDLDSHKELIEATKECPETSHIIVQNGKIDRLHNKLDRMWNRLIGLIMAICAIATGVVVWKEYFDG